MSMNADTSQILAAMRSLTIRVKNLETMPHGNGGAPGTGGHVIQDEGVNLPQQLHLNFTGDGVTASDNAITGATDVTIPGAGAPGTGGHIIQDEGVDLPAELHLNFIGAGVTATDNAITGATDVTIPGGGVGTEFENKVIWFNAGDSTITFYDHTSAGFDAALAVAGPGDMVVIPVDTIPDDHVIPANVTVVGWSREGCVLSGKITLSDGSGLETLSVIRSVNTGSATYGVVGPNGVGEIGYLFDVTVAVTNAGSGNVGALVSRAFGKVIADHCILAGISIGGDGYGFWLLPTAHTGVTAFSYDEPCSVVTTVGTTARETLPITPPSGGNCGDVSTSCLIQGIMGGGPSYVVYDLGRMWRLSRIDVRWANQGRVEIWNTPNDSEKLLNPRSWPGQIWWDNAPWAGFSCGTVPYTVPLPGSGGTQYARYLAFMNEYYVMVGDHDWLAWWSMTGDYDDLGSAELYYNRISGSTVSVKAHDMENKVDVYGNEWDDYEGLIQFLLGNRSAWDDINYPARHAHDIADATPIHHTPEPGTAGNMIFDDGTKWVSDAPADSFPRGVGGHVIQEEGAPLTSRPNLNFKGTAVTAADNAGTTSTDVTVNAFSPAISSEIQACTLKVSPVNGDVILAEDSANAFSKVRIPFASFAATGGHVIEDDGTPMTQRPDLDFIGFDVQDDAGNNRTTVAINGGVLEDLSGQVPGPGDHYDVAHEIFGSNIIVFKNGLMQQPSSITIDVDGMGFTTDSTFVAGDILVVEINTAHMAVVEQVYTFSFFGLLEVASPSARIYNCTTRNRAISKVFLSVNNASSSGSVTCNVYVNGTSIFTVAGHKPSVAAGANTGQTVDIDLPAWNAGDYMQASIEAVGTNVSDLVIHIVCS